MYKFPKNSHPRRLLSRRDGSCVEGYTIIEVLMITSLVTILLSLVIVMVNPITHFSATRNAERWNHVNMIGNALHKYRLDYNLLFPEGVTPSPKEVCGAGVAARICSENNLLDLSVLVPAYLTRIPEDPSVVQGNGAGYSISYVEGKGMIVTSLYAEGGDTITLRR